MVKKKAAPSGKLLVTQVRSLSGRPDKHRRTIEALGLRRLKSSVVHDDTPAIRGMIKQVIHLISVQNVD